MTSTPQDGIQKWQPWWVGACCLAVIPGIAQALYVPLGIVAFFLMQDSIAPAEKADALAAMMEGARVATAAHIIVVIPSGFAFGALSKAGSRALANFLYATPAALIVTYVSLPNIAGAALAFLVSILAGLGAACLGNYFSSRTKQSPATRETTPTPDFKEQVAAIRARQARKHAEKQREETRTEIGNP